MTVTVTGTVDYVNGVPDRSKWVFSSELRVGSDGSSVISPNLVVATPDVSGVLTVSLDPGLAIVKYGNTVVRVTVPNTDVGLWDLIGAGVILPPATTDDKIAAAVVAYMLAHNIDEYHEYANLAAFPVTGVADRIYVAISPNGSFYRWNGSTSAYEQIAGNAATALKLLTARNINGVAFDGTADITVVDATKQPVLTATAVKTSAYTAAVSDLIPADATAAPFTITLPTGPADRARVVVKKIDSTANVVTVAAAGSDVFNKSGGSTTLALSLQYQAVQLQYKASGAIWYVVSTDIPLVGLDARYAPITISAAAGWGNTVVDYQAQPNRPAVVMIGDSISFLNQVATTWSGASGSRTNGFMSVGYLTCAMVWNRQPGNWLNKGVSTQWSADGLARFDTDVTPFRPQVVVVEFGTNDIANNVTAATCFANLLAMWTKAWAFGAKVIALTCPPRGTAGIFTSTQAQEANKLNALIRNYANTNPDNFAVVDMWAALADPLTGQYKTGYSTDGTHPNAAGAWALGKAFEPALDRFLPAATPNLAADNVYDADNLLINVTPLMTATGGSVTSNKGLTGVLPAGWLATSTGTNATLTSVLSQVPRTDGYGNWQQINTTVLPGSTDYVQLNRGVSAGFSAGDIVQACVEFETDSAGWTNGIFDLVIVMTDVSNNLLQVIGSFSPANGETIVAVRPESGILQTPAAVVPPGTTSVAYHVNYGGLGTARFGRCALRKLAA